MKQAIALAGGGTKGAYQVGAWKAMRELGIPFDIVTGTSIGSVTAALMVQGDFDRAWELWTHITEDQIMLERADTTPREKRELAALAEHPEQLIARVKDWADLNRRTADITPYRALVHQYLDEARFFASPVDFGLMTARFPSFQPVEVRKQDIAPGYLPQWILASSACYPMFPMCEIDGQNYLDGAYSDNLPIGTAFRLGADRVIAIGLKPETPEKKYTNHPLVTYIAPAEPLGKLLEFDPDALRHSIALGYTDTLRVLGSYIGHTYTFEPDGQTLLEGVARDYLLWLLRRELTPPDSMLDFFRSDTPLTDRILSDQRSDLTACALAGAECVLEAYAYPRGEIYDLKLLLPELAMRLAEDEDTPELERARAVRVAGQRAFLHAARPAHAALRRQGHLPRHTHALSARADGLTGRFLLHSREKSGILSRFDIRKNNRGADYGSETGNRAPPDVCDHLAPGRRQDDAHGKAAAVRRGHPARRLGQGQGDRAPRGLGLDGTRKAARHLHHVVGHAV